MSKLKLILVTAFSNWLDMTPFFASNSFRIVSRTACRLHGTSLANDASCRSSSCRKYGFDGAVNGRLAVTIQPTVNSLAFVTLDLAVGNSRQRRFEGGRMSARDDSSSTLASTSVTMWNLD